MTTVLMKIGYMLDLNALLFAITLITALAGLIVLVVRPIRNMLRAYNSTLTDLQATITDQATVNEVQAQCIRDSVQDRQEIREDMDIIKAALVTILKVELEKQCAKAIQAGGVTVERKQAIQEMFAEYCRLGGNHGMNARVNIVLGLPVALKIKEEE